MRIYISGPITGMPNLNREAFSAAEAAIIEDGYIAVNPHEIARLLERQRAPMAGPASWSDYMRPCIRALVGCDSILLLLGWAESRGAVLEERIASELGLGRHPDSSVE